MELAILAGIGLTGYYLNNDNKTDENCVPNNSESAFGSNLYNQSCLEKMQKKYPKKSNIGKNPGMKYKPRYRNNLSERVENGIDHIGNTCSKNFLTNDKTYYPYKKQSDKKFG